jgi:hypothetical protein
VTVTFKDELSVARSGGLKVIKWPSVVTE